MQAHCYAARWHNMQTDVGLFRSIWFVCVLYVHFCFEFASRLCVLFLRMWILLCFLPYRFDCVCGCLCVSMYFGLMFVLCLWTLFWLWIFVLRLFLMNFAMHLWIFVCSTFWFVATRCACAERAPLSSLPTQQRYFFCVMAQVCHFLHLVCLLQLLGIWSKRGGDALESPTKTNQTSDEHATCGWL